MTLATCSCADVGTLPDAELLSVIPFAVSSWRFYLSLRLTEWERAWKSDDGVPSRSSGDRSNTLRPFLVCSSWQSPIVSHVAKRWSKSRVQPTKRNIAREIREGREREREVNGRMDEDSKTGNSWWATRVWEERQLWGYCAKPNSIITGLSKISSISFDRPLQPPSPSLPHFLAILHFPLHARLVHYLFFEFNFETGASAVLVAIGESIEAKQHQRELLGLIICISSYIIHRASDWNPQTGAWWTLASQFRISNSLDGRSCTAR